MDSGTLSALSQAVAELDPHIQDFAAQVTGAPSGELAGWLAEHLPHQQRTTQLRILTEAASRSRAARGVPLKVLAPLLEGASLEDADDEPMVARWAGLLASAADPGRDPLPPSFPAILRELSSLEAATLELIVTATTDNARERPTGSTDRAELLDLHTNFLHMHAAPSTTALDLALENLYRLRLADEGRPRTEDGLLIWATELGRAFVDACHV